MNWETQDAGNVDLAFLVGETLQAIETWDTFIRMTFESGELRLTGDAGGYQQVEWTERAKETP